LRDLCDHEQKLGSIQKESNQYIACYGK